MEYIELVVAAGAAATAGITIIMPTAAESVATVDVQQSGAGSDGGRYCNSRGCCNSGYYIAWADNMLLGLAAAGDSLDERCNYM